MKITMKTNNVATIYNNNVKKMTSTEGPSKAKDTVELSGAGKELSRYIEMAKDVELKNSRVEEIKKSLQNKSYNIDSSKLARSLMDSLREGDK